jgi:O-antigen ligase
VTGHSRGSRLQLSERLLVAQSTLLVVVASWAFGGAIDWAPPLIIGLAGLGVIPLVAAWREGRSAQRPKAPSLMLLPWIVLGAVVVGSCFNPSYQPMPPELGSGLALREHVEWLPSSAAPAQTVAAGSLLAALLFQAAVVYRVVQRRRTVQLLLGLICFNTTLLAVAGTMAHLLGAERILGLQPAPEPYFFATFVYKNHWSAFALLSLCSAIGLLFTYRVRSLEEQRQSRGSPLPLFIAMAALIAVTIPLKESRSGTTLLAVVLLALLGRAAGWALTHRRLSVGQRLGTIGGIAALGIGFGWFTYSLAEPAIRGGIARTEQQVDAYRTQQQWEIRFYINRDTWNMAQARPWWGWGLGTYPQVIPAFQGDEFRHPRTGELRNRFIDAHNDWLQFLAELGWIGLGLLILPPLLAWARYVVTRKGDSTSRWTLFGCALILVYAAGDFPFQNPAVFAAFAILFAAATKTGTLARRQSARPAPAPL